MKQIHKVTSDTFSTEYFTTKRKVDEFIKYAEFNYALGRRVSTMTSGDKMSIFYVSGEEMLIEKITLNTFVR